MPVPQESLLQADRDRMLSLFLAGSHAELESLARALLEQHPDSGFAWKVLGACLQAQRKDALPAMQRAACLVPDDAEVHYNLGIALNALGRLDEAVTSYRRATEIQPEFFEAHGNLGTALADLGRLDEAMASYRSALAHRPDFVDAHCNLGNVLKDLGCHIEAEASYRRALALRPDFADAYSNLLFCLSHREGIGPDQLFAEHCRFAERYEAPLKAAWPVHANRKDENRKLRIGFVSADLWNHAVANFIEPVWRCLNREHIDLWVYSNGVAEDEVTRRLRGLADHWLSVVGWSHAALASRVGADKIDILVDLSGHTAHNRLLSFARKPAPLQVSWIGYPGTSGLTAIDYTFGDRFLTPPGKIDSLYVEKIIRLPSAGSFEPYLDAPEVAPLPALNKGYVTFGSFNRTAKLGESLIGLWCEVLRAVPGSCLLVGGVGDGETARRLASRFAALGVDPSRLVFHQRGSLRDYLALHAQVDIVLDSFPYNGGTTTHHALWAGVPVLTLAGLTRTERAGAAILGRIGLDDWVVDSAAAYVDRARRGAADLPGLAALRAGMRRRIQGSPLRQPETVARGLEEAFRVMWRRWCRGLPAESFAIGIGKDVIRTM